MRQFSLRARRLAVWTAIALLNVFPALSLGQISQSIITSSTPLSADQQRQVTAFAQEWSAVLGRDSARDSAEARRTLMAPLSRNDASVHFRRALSDALVPPLADLLADTALPVNTHLNAVQVLGVMGTDAAVAQLGVALQSEKPAVRYATAMAFERTFLLAAANQAVFDLRVAVPDIGRTLRNAISAESDANVLAALCAACSAAPTPSVAVDNLCRGLMGQIRGAYEDGELDRFEAAAEGLRLVRRTYIERVLGAGASLPADIQKTMVEAGVLALMAAIEAGRSDLAESEQAPLLYGLAEAGEGLLNLISGIATPNLQASRAVEGRNYDEAHNALEGFWLADAGPILSNRQWGFTRGSFNDFLDQP